jgi:hypothetical protein
MSVEANRKYAKHRLTIKDLALDSNLQHCPESRAATPASIVPLLVCFPTSFRTIPSLVDLVAMAAWLGQHELDNVLDIGYLIAMLAEGEKEPVMPDWKGVGKG